MKGVYTVMDMNPKLDRKSEHRWQLMDSKKWWSQ